MTTSPTRMDLEDALDDLLDRYEGFTESDADYIRELYDTSPIRKERDEAVAEFERYRDTALRYKFEEVGITLKPEHLNIPDDLDPLDVDGLRSWAVENGLIDDEPDPAA